MPLTYSLVGGVLAVLEVLQAIQIVLGTHSIVNQLLASSALSSSSAEVKVLSQWLVVGKCCFAVGLVGSVLAQDALARSVLSVGFTLSLLAYFWTLAPALRHAETQGKLKPGTEYAVTVSMVLLLSLLSVASYMEVQQLLLQ
jgi:hypothetical protein